MGRRAPEPEDDDLEDDDIDDDIDEAERGEGDEEEVDVPKARAKVLPSTRATPEQTRALDLRIFEAADRLEAKLGRAPKQLEIADAAKVPGTTDAQRVRVAKALRRRGLLTAVARAGQAGAGCTLAPKPVPAPPPSDATPGVRAVEALRDRLRHQLGAVEVTLAALRGEP